MIKSELEQEILELCAEDYFGVWELYWPHKNSQGKCPKDIDLFVDTIKELIGTKRIACYEQRQGTKEFHPVTLDLGRLKSEVEQIESGNISWDFYWFTKIKPACK